MSILGWVIAGLYSLFGLGFWGAIVYSMWQLRNSTDADRKWERLEYGP